MLDRGDEPWDKPFAVVGVDTNSCGIMNILPLIIAALLVVVILGGIVVSKNGLDGATIVTLAGIAIATIIAIIILASVLSGVC